MTISGGVATFSEDGSTTSGLLMTADRALYQAKQSGRNRIVRGRQLGLDGRPLSQTR